MLQSLPKMPPFQRFAEGVLLVLAAVGGAACSASDAQGGPPPIGAAGAGATNPTGSGGSGPAGSGGTGQPGTGGTGAGATPGSGGTGATGGGGASKDAGDDVTFDWPESVPGRGECKPGTYQGTFQCTYTDPMGGNPIPANGPITLKLVQSQNGEFLEVQDGLLDGTANVFFTFRANISGKLDCKTASFSGSLINGIYSGFLIVNGTFQGPLSSQYDLLKYAFVGGTWQLIVGGVGGSCNGTWSANYTGP